MSTYAERQAYRDAHPGVVVDNNSSSDGGFHSSTPDGTPSGGGGGGGGGGGRGNATPSAPAQTAPAVSSGPVYQTSNGPKTVDQMREELFQAGWDGSGTIESAYARTTGGAVTAADPTAVVPPVAPTALTSWEQAQIDAFKAGSGFSIKQLEEQRRQFDEQLAWQKQMWLNQGLPQLEINRRAQALAEKAQADAMSMAQANLGLDYAKTAASLGGPSDYFQQSQFLRAAQATGKLPSFLQSLRDNTGLSAFNAPGGTAPVPQSMTTLASGLTGLSGTGGGAATPVGNDQALSAIGQIGATGAQALAPQALEQLSPDEMGLLQSGLKASGYSMPSFLQAYKQSRIGQGAAQAA